MNTAWEYLVALQRQLTPLPLPTADCTGKTVIVTGANTGLGREAARHFARLGSARVILACRDVAKGEAARTAIAASLGVAGSSNDSSSSSYYDVETKGGADTGSRDAARPPTQLEVWELDQGSFASVRAFAGRAKTELEGRLDHVVLNAAVCPGPGSPVRRREGYEESVTVNVLAPFLLALLLLPTLRRRPAPTSVNGAGADDFVSLCFVASSAHHYAKFPQRHAPRVFEALRGGGDMVNRYAVTKLLVVLLARSLASALTTSSSAPGPRVVVNTVDPGLCATEVLRHLEGPLAWMLRTVMAAVARPAEAGARTLVWAALAGPSAHGRYLQHAGRVAPESAYVRGPDGARDQERVWAELLTILDIAVPDIAANLPA